jgi:hypothetical protein
MAKSLERRYAPAPTLPSPAAPWGQQLPGVTTYTRWLVGRCGVTQPVTADLLNALGFRAKRGREWQRAIVSALVNSRFDAG